MKYTLIKRGDPRKPKGKKKIYATFQSSGTVKLETSDHSSSLFGSACNGKHGEAISFIYELADLVKTKLEQGFVVDLGPLGKFTPSFQCEGLAEDANHPFDPHSQIKKITTRWTPGFHLESLTVGKGEYEKSAKRKTYRRKK
ncbi:MAG: hypothetical protein KBS94_03235 [Prevotella sp.]|nr:hypothetical protein [Candidatus Equicola faecalis]